MKSFLSYVVAAILLKKKSMISVRLSKFFRIAILNVLKATDKSKNSQLKILSCGFNED